MTESQQAMAKKLANACQPPLPYTRLETVIPCMLQNRVPKPPLHLKTPLICLLQASCRPLLAAPC